MEFSIFGEESKNYFSHLEALLFVAGDAGIDIVEISSAFELTNDESNAFVLELKEKYDADDFSAFTILKTGTKYTLVTKKRLHEFLSEFTTRSQNHALSQSALETLSIIAYKQPIARARVDEIRGVGSSAAIQKLVSRQLVEAKGRLEAPGRPILYGTTEYFMNYFGLKSLEDLPDTTAMEQEFAKDVEQDLFYNRYEGKDIEFDDNEDDDTEEIDLLEAVTEEATSQVEENEGDDDGEIE